MKVIRIALALVTTAAAPVVGLGTGHCGGVDARIVYEGNRPFISVNGCRHAPEWVICGTESEYERQFIAKSYDLGFRFYNIGLKVDKDVETAVGEYDFSALDEQAKTVLTNAPGAMLVLSAWFELPKWCAAHPEETIGYADGAAGEGDTDELKGRPIRPSAASLEFRRELTRFFDRLGEYVRSRPWADRVVAVRPAWGVYTEWHCWGMYHFPDTGAAMTAAFRGYKDGLYAKEDPPTAEERTSGGYLLDPVKQRKVIDFYDCMAEVIANLLIFTCRESKRVLPGRLAGAYSGYVLDPHPPEGANVLLDKVLSSGAVDFISDPTAYSPLSRRAGGAYYHRTVPSTAHRYGKLVLIEDDMRFHHLAGVSRLAKIYTADARESRMTMRRNYLNTLFNGVGIQLNDPMGKRGKRPYAYDDPDVLQGLREAKAVAAKAGFVSAESGNEVAVVVSCRERLRRNGKSSHDLVYLSPRSLYRTGVSFDLLTLEDYLASGQRYAQVILLNVFNPTAEERAGLEARNRGAAVRWFTADEHEAYPSTPDQWRAEFDRLGAKAMTVPRAYVRRQGDLVLFHTARAGNWRLALPDGATGAEELFSGRTFEGQVLKFETDGVDTLLFKMRQSQNPVVGAFPRNAHEKDRTNSFLSAHFTEMRPHESEALQLPQMNVATGNNHTIIPKGERQ